MNRHVLFAAVILLLMTGSVHADVGPNFGTPDFGRSSPAGNAFFGLSLSALVIFGGYWIFRNPRAGIAAICLVTGIGFFLLSLTILGLFGPLVLFFSLVGAVLAFWGGRRAFSSWAPFVGRDLVFLLLTLGALAATLISLSELAWTNPRREQRERQFERQRLREREAKERDSKEKQPIEPQ